MAFIEFLEGEKHPAKNADVMDSPNKFKDAGYLLEDDDLIIDIDGIERDVLEKFIQIFDINTHTVWTDRGVHFYFKKPKGFKGASHIAPLGIEVETKHSGNTKAITVKRNGVLRDINNAGKREELPEVLAPIKTKSTPKSLYGLDDGDGRNPAMFAHKAMISYLPNMVQIMRFINSHILAEPLDEKEFEAVTRDTRIRDDDSKYIRAEKIRIHYNVVKFRNELYFKHEGVFTNDLDLLNKLVYREVGEQRSTYVDEIIKQLEKRAYTIADDKIFDIQFNNGILRNGNFIKIDYQEFTPFRIDIDYKTDAKPVKEVDDYIDHLTNHDKAYRELLMEILGHTLIVNPELKRLLAKFFIFVGDGGNGKGTLLTIIRKILNQENCAGLSISEMSDERYIVSLKGKLANLGDDIQDEPINNKQMKILKNISTSDYIAIRELYSSPMQLVLTTSLIFTSNHILKSFEKGESYKRRVLWLPMYSKPKTKDPLFITKLTTKEALEYWVRLIVEGYQRLYKTQMFTQPKLVADFNHNYHEENNSALTFARDLIPEEIHGIQPPKVFEQYETWAEENGLNALGKKTFNDTVCQVLNMEIKNKKINKKTARVYLMLEDEG